MGLQEIKKMLAECPCHPEIALKAQEIMDAAIARGSLTKDEQTKIIALMDLEVQANDIEADALEAKAQAFTNFADESEQILTEAEAELLALDRALAAA
jgi:polyhydroxyalkanoate synthesis regulator phasin